MLMPPMTPHFIRVPNTLPISRSSDTSTPKAAPVSSSTIAVSFVRAEYACIAIIPSGVAWMSLRNPHVLVFPSGVIGTSFPARIEDRALIKSHITVVINPLRHTVDVTND